jgi:hypothetical protein
MVASLHPRVQRGDRCEELARESIRLLLEGIGALPLYRIDAVDHSGVAETMMAELVREREALSLDELSPVEEDERLVAPDHVRARNSVAELENRNRDPLDLLDDPEEVVDRLVRSQSVLLASEAGGSYRLANVRRCHA